jgi:hypothetical protein
MVRVCHWHVGVMVKMIVPMELMSKTVVRFFANSACNLFMVICVFVVIIIIIAVNKSPVTAVSVI